MWSQKGFKARLAVVVIASLVLIVNSFTNFMIVQDFPQCIKDVFLQLTDPLNQFLMNHNLLRNIWMIISSFLLDIIVVFTSYSWIMNGKTWKPIVAVILFFSLKLICSSLFIVKYPEGMMWDYPGFPSFSGYVGLNLICYLELRKLNLINISYLALFELIFQSLMLLSLRANYTVDILSSILAAHYLYLASTQITEYINTKINLDEELTTPRQLETVKI
jgi:hypothetical protein